MRKACCESERMKSNFSNITVTSFCICLVVLASLLIWFQSPSTKDAFSIPANVPVSVGPRAKDVLSAKLAHARANPAYAIGAFGNSRIIALERRHLGDLGDRFFNFAIPGTSFRTTVATIETLAREGKVPSVSIVSLDNLSLEYFGPALIPNAFNRYGAILHDIAFGFGNDTIPKSQVLRAVWRSIWNEWILITEALNFNFLSSVLNQLKTVASLYQNDGSVPMRHTENWGTRFPPLVVGKAQILIGFLAEDIRRLAYVQVVSASRIVIIESPIHPSVKLDSSTANEYRQYLKQVCQKATLECQFQPLDNIATDDLMWPDSTHAPPQIWARTILPIWQAAAGAS